MLDTNWNPSQRDLRQFAGIWLPAFAALVGFFLYRGGFREAALVLWAVAGVIAVIGMLRPSWVKPVFVGWMAAAYPIGWTISHIILGLTYFGLFTFVALIMRAVGYDPLNRRRTGTASTYWVEHEQRRDPGSYFRQF